MKVKALNSAWEAVKSNQEFLPFLREMHLLQLEEIAKKRHLGINNVSIVAVGPGGRVCFYCAEQNDKVLNLDEEIKQQTLPHQRCSCTAYEENKTGFCLCYYEMVFDDEM